MITTLALLGYATVLGFTGARLLVRGEWADRAPRLGIVVWQAAQVSVLAAAVLAGLTLAVPGVWAAHGIAELFDACEMIMRTHYGTSGGPVIAGMASAAGVAAWTAGHCVHALVTTAWRRRAHAESLA